MIGFAGLSHLGLVSSIATAAKGFSVLGFDSRTGLCSDLGQGKLPLFEPNLGELLGSKKERIQFTADPRELGKCELIYLSLDVATDEDNHSDLSAYGPLLETVATHAAPGAVLVLLSQVPPGFTRGWTAVLHEKFAEKKLHLYYQVETLIFGRAVERALHPERIMVGCAEPRAALPPVYAKLLESFGCPIFRMRFESAELSKISINFCLVAMVSVANTLSEVCEAVGADWSEIVPTLKLDRRIGPHAYLQPGLGLSGGNLERDLITVKNLACTWGTDAGIVDAWLTNSRHRRDWVLRALHREVLSKKANPTIALWGLAYKQDTTSTKNSPALALLESLGRLRVRAYDPQAELPGGSFANVVPCGNALEVCTDADVLAVMTPWKEFASVPPAEVATRMRGRVVLDPLAVLEATAWQEQGFSYHRLGTYWEAA
jgi:UDPglucose 6-dehydrogenase